MKMNEKLVRLRIQAGLSQVELAEELGISRQTVSKWESGATTPSPENLTRLGRLYHVTVGSLLDEENKIQRVEEHEEKEHGRADKKESLRSKHVRRVILLLCCVAVILICAITMFHQKGGNTEKISSLEKEKVDISVIEELPVIW